MAVLWKSRRRTSLTALASPHSSSHLHLRCPPFFIWHCSFDRSWHQHCQQITKRFETALKNVSKTRPGLWILSRLSRIPIILHFLSLSTRPPLLSPPPPSFHHVSALSVYYSLPCGSVPFSCKSVLCCLLFFFFYLVYAFCTACHAVCDCHLSPCERAKCCCVFLPLSVSFIHSPSSSSSRLLRGECMWLRKQMYNDSTRRGPSNWASEARVSLASTCVGYSSPILFDSFFFPDLSITNSASCRSGVTGGPCERSSEIDRQVRELIVVQDTSAGAQRYSSYTSPASPPLYTILPPCEERSLIHSPPNCFFSVTHAPGKPGLLAGIHRLLPPPLPDIGLAWKNHAGSTSATPDWRGLPSRLQHVLSTSL